MAASGIMGLDSLRNKEIFEKFWVAERARCVNYEVAGWVKRGTL